ncbi:GntR family transcriptional regulator [Heyndrickxia vini]|uniref:GntR family transcriptional regulator n=1 Tax=Heyndrickxia vini TaxID=1476025 RepID=A0ABX7E5M0_9BACI|nr:GntR family transcriptional regulator [Heyndrickxia vini]QQZ10757.1 GntR family transcriptional regulator [Heyndrickxia vini]
MTEEFLATKPIYLQIADRIFQQIVRGELCPGDKLASVREMAIQTGVNPNTIQRTYGEMERMGIVETKRGQGTFVTEKTEVLDHLRNRMQTEIVQTFVESMRKIGITKDEMVNGLEQYLRWEDDGY